MLAERVITVEYLDPSMSRELLCKFPDDSAFGFDYSQSAIWSPLLPRARNMSCSICQDKICGASRFFSPVGLRRVKEKMIKKKKKKMMKVMQGSFKRRLDYSSISPPKRGWKRMFRAAAKRFMAQHLFTLLRIVPNHGD
ncbi:uncharacterized protein LOC110039572 [Phalaenopsis equestris]|uniref:uncharacterized protein LOC110039572 n=1 Tax=Phalaenopsis equestris TaxID=78828 RepID=UPI0009E53E7F|nr:uncharacterized protein LOC110039572 [Phalaenopsis equestris]